MLEEKNTKSVNLPFKYKKHIYGINISHLKRLSEFLNSDPKFEVDFYKSPQKTLDFNNLDIDAKLIRPIWDREMLKDIVDKNKDHPVISAQKYLNENVVDIPFKESIEDGNFKNIAYTSWRARQQQRTSSQLHKLHNDQLPHIPLAFELSKGCSGKCFFCALSSTPLQAVYKYTKDNIALWEGVLKECLEIFGISSGRPAICYWGTDPFDNPDYEGFCKTYAKVFNCFPQTTTALHHRDVKRTRDFLRLAAEHKRPFNRLSIASLKKLHNLFAAFTPEELLTVKLVLNNPESKSLYTNCGRARLAAGDIIKKDKIYKEGTSACLSGFLINMVDKSVTLLTPVNPSDKFPNGFQTVNLATFTNQHNFRESILNMIKTHMPVVPRKNFILRFRDDVIFKATEDGFTANTRFMKRSFSGSSTIVKIGEMISLSKYTVNDIYDILTWSYIPDSVIDDTLQKIFDAGLLYE